MEKFVITNDTKNDLFLTVGSNQKFQWTPNIELAYTFDTELKAWEYIDWTACDFLNYETDEFSDVKPLSNFTTLN